ncbi:MaoC family dehydratase N-terminal domain-containing protein [Aestuariivirga sp.]|uniref:FAS1-like dehydratase domain-containing protein n=1 Tax=Aestuariivirga sp. TaxID=2650926 RepID=UPI0039E4E2AC
MSDLRDWIGREREAGDEISPRLAECFASIFGGEGDLSLGAPAPLGIHWCLAPDIVPISETGPDGHPARGGFLPPVPLPRRMWAGGQLAFHGGLRVGDRVRRHSRIDDVVMKEGRSGRLCFVTVTHRYLTARGEALSERHDIVYRGLDAAASPAPAAQDVPEVSETIAATPLLLFRYSAVTFNSHRIHYDRPYCLNEEHYPGLLVHGPLQATCLLRLAARRNTGEAPRLFTYRGVSPLFDGGAFSVNARGSDYWISGPEGNVTMKASTAQA